MSTKSPDCVGKRLGKLQLRIEKGKGTNDLFKRKVSKLEGEVHSRMALFFLFANEKFIQREDIHAKLQFLKRFQTL